MLLLLYKTPEGEKMDRIQKKEDGRRILTGTVLICLLVAGMTACAGSRQKDRIEATIPETASQIETENHAETEQPPKTMNQITETVKRAEETAAGPVPGAEKGTTGAASTREAYASVLRELLENQKFPGGQDYGYDGSGLANNKFAVYDIDADGRDELMILYTTTYSAGMTEQIYDFDSQSGAVREQFVEYLSNRYYDNGIVESDLSHNQGLAGRFWPYTVYRYDRETDSYESIVSVDAWDKSLRDTDYDGKPFPDEADKNGDLLIYYIIPAGSDTADPVDQEEYEQWRNSLLGGTEQLSIPYMPLTEENIESIK